jgi:hydrogenase maturation protease
MARIVIIGCGSSLRADDRFGLAVADRLADRFAGNPQVEIITAVQLLPEHTAHLRDARLVLVVDASVENPGTISCRLVKSSPDGGRPSLAHTYTPEHLVQLAMELHGRRPRVLVLTAGAYSFDVADTMTLSMSALADRTVDEVAIRLRRRLTVSHPARTATLPEQSAASVENASNH